MCKHRYYEYGQIFIPSLWAEGALKNAFSYMSLNFSRVPIPEAHTLHLTKVVFE